MEYWGIKRNIHPCHLLLGELAELQLLVAVQLHLLGVVIPPSPPPPLAGTP